MFCPKCGNPVNGSFCGKCGAKIDIPVYQEQTSQFISGENKIPNQPKTSAGGINNFIASLKNNQKKALSIIIPAVAIILVIALVLGIVLGGATSKKKPAGLALALQKTLMEAEEFDFEANFYYAEDGDRDENEIASGSVRWGNNLSDSSLLLDFDYGETLAVSEGKFVIDGFALNAPEIVAWAQENGEQTYNKYVPRDSEIDDAVNTILEELGYDFNEVIDLALDIVKNHKLNEDVVETIYNLAVDHAQSVLIDMNDYFDDYSEIAEEVDTSVIPSYSEFKKTITKFIAGLGKDVFKVTDTYKEDGVKYYVATVNPKALANEAYDFILKNSTCKKLLNEVNRVFEVITGEDDFYDLLSEAFDDITEEAEDINVFITYGIKSGYLTSFDLSVSYRDDDEREGIHVELSNINKTKADFEEEYYRTFDEENAVEMSPKKLLNMYEEELY